MNDWINMTLDDVANIQIGGTPSREISAYWASTYDSGFPWVSIADLKENVIVETKERITEKGILHSNVKLIREGTLIISFKLSIGRAALAGIDLFTNEAIAAITPKDRRIHSKLLYYVLPIVAQNAITDTAVKGATLNKASLGKLSFRVPSEYSEQKKIANILNTIDRTIAKTEALIEKYQQIKAGLMHDLFTRGIGADGKLRPPREVAPELYKNSAIGWIPNEWEVEILDRLTQRGSGHTPNKSIDSYWNGGLKWVSLADSRKLDNLYIFDTDLEISELGIQNSSAVIHPKGTVIMTRDAGVGKSAIISEPMAVSQHFMAWRCGEGMNNYFLYYWLQYKKRMFENVAMGSTIVTIGLAYFKKLKIAAPILKTEQEGIGEKLRFTDTHIFSLKSDLKKLKYKKSGLMQDLLTAKVSVNVNSDAP